MGGVVSDARSNSDLVEKLIRENLTNLTKREIEILYIVDRGRFLTEPNQYDPIPNPYEDRVWRTEDFYLGPLSYYCEVLRGLKLKKGQSVLNIASGVGFFGLIASSLVGVGGHFIGVEHCPKTTHYAATRHQNFVHRSSTFDMQEFCEPIYLTGDILKFKPAFAKFDRCFCDAVVTVEVLPILLSFLKIGGILVVAVDDQNAQSALLELRRLDERRFFTKILSYVQSTSFKALMTDNGSIYDLYPKSQPASDLFKGSTSENTVILEYCLDNVPNLFPGSVEQEIWPKFDLQPKPPSLKKLCRGIIRQSLRLRFEQLAGEELKKQYFAENFMTNFQYELHTARIIYLSLTSCCLKRTDVTSKLNCKFKDYRKALEVGLENLKKAKKGLCERCRVLDQLTLVEFDDLLHDSHYRRSLHERLARLPLPGPLLRFVNYNRTFDLNEENFYSPIESRQFALETQKETGETQDRRI